MPTRTAAAATAIKACQNDQRRIKRAVRLPRKSTAAQEYSRDLRYRAAEVVALLDQLLPCGFHRLVEGGQGLEGSVVAHEFEGVRCDRPVIGVERSADGVLGQHVVDVGLVGVNAKLLDGVVEQVEGAKARIRNDSFEQSAVRQSRNLRLLRLLCCRGFRSVDFVRRRWHRLARRVRLKLRSHLAGVGSRLRHAKKGEEGKDGGSTHGDVG
jgi:hypothetical protein